MAIIYSYPTGTVKATDMLIGSDPTIVGNPTKNFRVGDISTFVKDDILGYTQYTSLVTQAGVTAPTDVILKNDTGVTMTWGYTSPGVYTLTSSSPIFTNNKTIVFLNMGRPAIPNLVWMWTRTSDTVITIENSAISDAKIVNGAFEIRIYS